MDAGKSPHQAREAAMRVIHSPVAQDRDDEIGVILDDLGCIPAEALGRHCKHCGDAIAVSTVLGEPHPGFRGAPGSVLEYRHSFTRLVHCALAFTDGHPVALAEETAEPCWREGCLLSEAGHDARTGEAGR